MRRPVGIRHLGNFHIRSCLMALRVKKKVPGLTVEDLKVEELKAQQMSAAQARGELTWNDQAIQALAVMRLILPRDSGWMTADHDAG